MEKIKFEMDLDALAFFVCYYLYQFMHISMIMKAPFVVNVVLEENVSGSYQSFREKKKKRETKNRITYR